MSYASSTGRAGGPVTGRRPSSSGSSSSKASRSAAELRKIAEQKALPLATRVQDAIDKALDYFEQYRAYSRKGEYESAYLAFWGSKQTLSAIPNHPSYAKLSKKGEFHITFTKLRDMVDSENVTLVEDHLDTEANKFKVSRKPVPQNESQPSTAEVDPLAARLERLRGPRPYPETKQPENVYVNGTNKRMSDTNGTVNGKPRGHKPPPPPVPNKPPPPTPPAKAPVLPVPPSLIPSTSGSPQPEYQHVHSQYQAPTPPLPQPPVIFAKSRYINAETLYSHLQKAGGSILLLDIRERKCFDAGHIPAPHVACIEPITISPGKTENDLEESMVIAPEKEREDFNNRHHFELIVYYDTDSLTNEFNSRDPEKSVLHQLTSSIYKYAYGKPLKREPCLLVGGFKTWMEDIGTVEPPKGKLLLPVASPANGSPANGSTHPGPYTTNVNDYFKREYQQKHDFATHSYPSTHSLHSQPDYRHHSPLHSQPYSSPHHSTPYLHSTSSSPMIMPQPNYASRPSNGSASEPPQSYHQHAYQQPQQHSQRPQITPQAAARGFATGLHNLGNTCYMNSIVQCLSGTPSFSIPFSDNSYTKYVNFNSRLGYRGELARTFAELIQTMYKPEVHKIAPNALKRLSGQIRDTFSGTEQQDCQEFLTFILDGLHEELNASGHKERLKQLTEDEERRREQLSVRQASTIEWERYLKSDYSLVVDTFQGQYQSKLQCLTCGYTSTTYNPFTSLSLPIPLNYNTVSLKDCFDLFTQSETLEGDNAWFCSHCRAARKSVKTMCISRLPQVLIIHLKRFQTSTSNRFMMSNKASANKLETFITYPHSLDLTEYWPPYSNDDEAKLAKLPERGQRPPFHYRLYAVAYHFGTLKGGHYTASVYKHQHGWCYFDDTKISHISKDRVVNNNAYVLFYSRQ